MPENFGSAPGPEQPRQTRPDVPVWQEMFYQQPPPLPATALPSPPPRPGPRRRRWTLVLTGVLSAGLAAGLVYWAPWHNPPAAPGAVVVTSGTATSALVSWARSTGGGAPDHYLVLRDGQQVGSSACVPAGSYRAPMIDSRAQLMK